MERFYMATDVRAGRLFGYDGPNFEAYWWFVGWWAISLGFHVCLRNPNIEIHLPFGFLRIGWPERQQ